MAQNDMYVVMCRIIACLYDCMKRGVEGKHLCPDCHDAYRHLKAEAEAALDERFGL